MDEVAVPFPSLAKLLFKGFKADDLDTAGADQRVVIENLEKPRLDVLQPLPLFMKLGPFVGIRRPRPNGQALNEVQHTLSGALFGHQVVPGKARRYPERATRNCATCLV